mgnify:CR=1 FL=1
MIPDDVVEEVRTRADIVEIIGEHVALKRAGKDFRALCPFHREKTPSFYVVPAKGFFKCFGCGESGDVFAFLMKRLGLGFNDAVRQVAERVGVEIPEPGRRSGDERHRPLYEAVAFAADFFRRQLWDEPVGEVARRYLERRGIPREAAERFLLGYAPDEWTALRDAAARHGIAEEVLFEAGLIKRSERRAEPYDRFRHRLIFPITDTAGRVIAFGGRMLGAAAERAPKYLNSPETPIYQKGRVLYGLSWAKQAIRREGEAIIVEGYMDYVSLAARGIENVVAPLGTAMTEEQAQLLARYTRKALLLYDSDPAGMRATFRTADALLAAGVHPMVVTLPQGEDPDSLVRRGGAAALKPLLDEAVDVLDRKLQILEAGGYFRDVERIRFALDKLLPTLRAAADETLRDIYVARVSERTGVRRDTLERELELERPVAHRSATAEARQQEAAQRDATERMLLLLLLRDRARVATAGELVRPEDLASSPARELYARLLAAGGNADEDPRAWELSPPARQLLEELLADPQDLTDGDRVFRNTIGDLRVRALFQRLDRLETESLRADAAREEELWRERLAIHAELRRLGSELADLGFKLSRRYRTYPGRGRIRQPGPMSKEG